MTDILLSRQVSTTLSVAALLFGINTSAEETTLYYATTVEFNLDTYWGTSGVAGQAFFAEQFFNEIVGPGVGAGGSGLDTINGGPDAADLRGGNGNDIINGFGGNDFITEGEGQDTIDGGGGAYPYW